MNDVEIRLLCLGAALHGVNTEGSEIVAEALAEMERLRKAAAKPTKKEIQEAEATSVTPQDAADVVAWLRSHGHARMALIVKTLHANYEAARRVNEQNVAACNALRDKYEPMFRYPSHKPPPEASG